MNRIFLYLNKGYGFKEIEYAVIKKEYIPRIRHVGEKPIIMINGINDRRHAKRRRVVERKKERTNLWHSNRLRKILVRCEKRIESNCTLVGVCLGCCVVSNGG
jgi:hypothetical protein